MRPIVWVLIAIVAIVAVVAGRVAGQVYKSDYAKCVAGTGDLDRDLNFCSRAIKSGDLSKEKLASTLYSRGWRYGRKGEYHGAIIDLDEAIELNPDFAQAFRVRGLVYDKKGEYDRAIANFNQAIGLKPDYADALHERGIAYAKKGEYDRAIADYNEAIRLNPIRRPSVVCPLWVKSRHSETTFRMSAFGGKADIIQGVAECPLIAKSGHTTLGRLMC